MSYGEIKELTSANKSTLHYWLRDYPLTEKEKKGKSLANRPKIKKPYKDRGQESKYHKMVGKRKLTRLEKGKISETAILFRLCINGFITFGSMFDGDKVDWLVEIPQKKKILKLQVKTVKKMRNGLPTVSLTCIKGHNEIVLYKKGDFDFIIGYDLFTDIAYVFSWNEIKNYKSQIAIRPENAERWDKLKE